MFCPDVPPVILSSTWSRGTIHISSEPKVALLGIVLNGHLTMLGTMLPMLGPTHSVASPDAVAQNEYPICLHGAPSFARRFNRRSRDGRQAKQRRHS